MNRSLETILIIEDDAGIIELLKEMFEQRGYEVSGVQSAAEAIDYLEHRSPVLVVLDYGLPDMNGQEFIGELKTRALKIPPFIVLTGQGDERIAVNMMKLGARDYVLKDIHFLEILPEVIRRVEKELENEKKLEQAEEKLLVTETLQRTVLDSLDDAIHLVDAELCIRLFGKRFRQWCEQLGFETNVVGKHVRDVFPFLSDTIISQYQQVLTTGKALTAQEETTFGEQVIITETRKIPVKTAGQVTGVLTIVTDITERKQAEEALKKAQNYISNIIDSMPSVLVGVDPDGKVTQWNTQAQRATGVPVEDAVGQPLARVFPRLASEMERVREAMQTHQVRANPRQARKQDGETRYEDVTVYPLIANGVEGAVIRVDDVTEQVRLDEMMVQSEKMLSVGGLAAGMAHEINNPLSGMMQTASVMANRLGRNIPANLRAAEAAGVSMDAVRAFMDARGIPRMLTAINESGRRVAGIVDNMLSFARRSDAQVSSHDVADLLDKAVELAATDYDLKKQYDFKMIEIVRDYEDNLPYVPCESAKIQQVLLNVLRNGAEAMQEVGADRLHPTEEPTFVLRTRYEKERGMVCIEIADNGPGMTESVRKRAFEPFFTTKPVGVGTGLGLSVSYFIVAENHGGEMDVVSEPGQGATFIIRLPVDKKGDEG